MKKLNLIGTILLLSFAIIACDRKIEQVRMVTGGVTGTYYSFGTAVSRILSEKTNIPITVHSTGASRANIRLIDEGEAELAIVQNDVMEYAWRGEDLFNGEQINSFASMAGLYAEVCQIVANPAVGIESIADLRGKNISVGDAGSGVEFNARQILEAYGISFNDIGKFNLNFAESAAAIRDNSIDAFFCVAGAPTPAIIDLATSRDVVLLEVDAEHARELIGKNPFYTPFPIPGGSYRGQPFPVMTVAVKATFIVSSKLSEDTVYRLTKTLFENKAKIISAHNKGREISPSYAVEGISVPFHPGAEKYLREIGALE